MRQYILQKKKNNFETDLFFPIIQEAAGLAGVPYGRSAESDVALKVISDHTRAITNMIADGILPSNEGRGYVLRRVLRRAVRYGKLIGIDDAFLGRMIDVVVKMMKPAYPELMEKQAFIKKVAGVEENRFHATLNAGMDLLAEMLEETLKKQRRILTGDRVFKLYDTYGFPWELTEEIAKEQGIEIDKDGFAAAMAEQKERARAARAKVSARIATPDTTKLKSESMTTEDTDGDTEILLLGKDGQAVQSAADGENITVILKNNPFHAEGGGQIGDSGVLEGNSGIISIEDTKKLPDGIVYCIGTVTEGVISTGETVKTVVDRERREDIARNHTGTHLLQAALRRVLGSQVNQAGSLVLPEKLRFDFTWPEAVTDKQIAEVERIVNEQIWKSTTLDIDEMPIAKAKEMGAIALFGEKYGDIVRVVRVPDFSTELCGGSHVFNTGEIGCFRIISESGIGSGIRRIEAITGKAAYESMLADRKLLRESAALLKVKVEEIPGKIEKNLAALKEAEREIERFKNQQTKDALGNLLKNVREKNGISFFGAIVPAANMDELRKAADIVKGKFPRGAFILGAAAGEKVNLVGMASEEAVKTGIHMGKVVSAAAKICGGGGGGKPAVAQAGGKNISELQNAIDEVKKSLTSLSINYQATDCFVNNCVVPSVLPNTDAERSSFGYALFWMAKRNFNVTLPFKTDEIVASICAGELQPSADAIRGLFEHPTLLESYQAAADVLVEKLIYEMQVLTFSITNDEVSCKFIPSISTETGFPENTKNTNQYWRIKMLDILNLKFQNYLF